VNGLCETPAVYPPEKELRYPRIRMLEVHQNRPGRFGVNINLLSLPGFKHQIIIHGIIRIIFLKKYFEVVN
jgi:hypothetical protein